MGGKWLAMERYIYWGGGAGFREQSVGRGDHRNSGTSSWLHLSSFPSDNQPSTASHTTPDGSVWEGWHSRRKILPLHTRKDSGRQHWDHKRSLLKFRFNNKQDQQLTGLSGRKLDLAFTSKSKRNVFYWVGSQTGFHVGSYLERFW